MNTKIIGKLIASLMLIGFSLALNAQYLKSGPMLGYNTMREVAIWVQTFDKDYVKVKYWSSKAADEFRYSEMFYTEPFKGNTATIKLTDLEPGTEYEYQVVVNDKDFPENQVRSFRTQELWQWRKDAPDFNFLAGSCVYINESEYDRPGTPYGKATSIFQEMAKEDASFMIWLGDNTYLREVDWNSRSGIYNRYSHTRGTKDLQGFLSKMHHYAIWDDHDYGPNDSDRTFWNKHITREAFEDFWANPVYGAGGSEGITGVFHWNDCAFYLLDDRWYRSFPANDGVLLGEQQLSWLIESLRSSKASFNFIAIGGQVLSDLKGFENFAIYEEERNKLLHLIDDYNIKNVVFLTGDRHHSEVSKYTTPDGDVIYDITSSPLTSGSYDHSDEVNNFRVKKDAIIGENNYAIFEVSGKKDNRKLKVIFKDVKGKKIKDFKLD